MADASATGACGEAMAAMAAAEGSSGPVSHYRPLEPQALGLRRSWRPSGFSCMKG
uniref:Uncharacterized protein n=1 Tax=Saimiri boliviensis boliviensis TaxID=39432 RepID=A0A2K6UU18_SAIBB